MAYLGPDPATWANVSEMKKLYERARRDCQHPRGLPARRFSLGGVGGYCPSQGAYSPGHEAGPTWGENVADFVDRTR
jgi:hypothetical protein